MKKALSSIWSGWKKLGLIIGGYVSSVFLTIFYFTVFAFVAIPFRIFTGNKKGNSSYIIKKSTISDLDGFKNE